MQSQHAFSLIEMLIVLVIVTILTAFAFPLLHNDSNRTGEALLRSQLSQAVEFAKQEAHARHLPIGLCQSKDHRTCSGNWSDGQLIFVDENKDGRVHNHEQILMVLPTHALHGRLNWRFYPYYRQYLQFLPTAMLNNNDGTFWYCRTRDKRPAWGLILSRSGRMRTAYPNESGELRDSRGNLLTCETS